MTRSKPRKERPTNDISTWHLKLSHIPSILKNNFHLISSNSKLSKIFKVKPNVTNRINKSLSDYPLKVDSSN